MAQIENVNILPETKIIFHLMEETVSVCIYEDTIQNYVRDVGIFHWKSF